MKLFFPYVENKIEGVFGKGIRKGVKINYSTLLSPELSGFPVSNCFDGKNSTFCHTENVPGVKQHYLQIQFLDLKINIIGFAIQNRQGNYWDLLNYDLQGSNNGVNFRTIKHFNEDSSQVCISGKTRTNRVSTLAYFSYIRFLKTGDRCNANKENEPSFNIGEVDLYGTLVSGIKTVQWNRLEYFIPQIFVLIIIIL